MRIMFNDGVYEMYSATEEKRFDDDGAYTIIRFEGDGYERNIHVEPYSANEIMKSLLVNGYVDLTGRKYW